MSIFKRLKNKKKIKNTQETTREQIKYANYLYRVPPVFWYDGSMSWWLRRVKPDIAITFEDFSCIPYEVDFEPSKNTELLAWTEDAKPVRNGNTITVGLTQKGKVDMIEKEYKKSNDFYLGILLAQEKEKLGLGK